MIDDDAVAVCLRHRFKRTIDIAKRTNRVRAAARDNVRVSSFCAKTRCDVFHCRFHVRPLGDFRDLRAKYPIEQNITRIQVGFGRIGNAFFENQFTIHAQLARGGCRLPRMVRLHCTLGDDDICFLLQRISHQKFKLASFVAACSKSSAIIALYVDLGAAQMLAQARQMFQRCG